MGLLKTGLKLGVAAYAVREVSKAINNHNNNNNNNQQQQQQQQQQQPYSQSQYPPQAYTDANGYAHQQWCNGRCGGRCNGSYVENREVTIRPQENDGFVTDSKRAPPQYSS